MTNNTAARLLDLIKTEQTPNLVRVAVRIREHDGWLSAYRTQQGGYGKLTGGVKILGEIKHSTLMISRFGRPTSSNLRPGWTDEQFIRRANTILGELQMDTLAVDLFEGTKALAPHPAWGDYVRGKMGFHSHIIGDMTPSDIQYWDNVAAEFAAEHGLEYERIWTED